LRRKVRDWIPAADNLRKIKEAGLENWLEEQKKRQSVLEKLLHNYNEGRSMGFFCKVCARMPVGLINTALNEAKKKIADEKVERSDLKSKAKIMKAALKDSASKANIRLA
jgi:aspartate aminotransferase-like enzyme